MRNSAGLRSTRRTNSACRQVWVFSNTCFKWRRAVFKLMLFFAAAQAKLLPVSKSRRFLHGQAVQLDQKHID